MVRTVLRAALIASLAVPLWASNALDGLVVKIKVTPDASAKEAGEKSFKDRLSFDAGRITAEESVKRGFGSTEYETHEDGPGTAFSATLVSGQEGTAVWGGTLAGKHAEGTLLWRKQDGRTFTYTFEGTAKKKKVD